MLFTPWYRRLTTGSPTRSRRPGSRPTRSRRSVLPRLELMEDRKLLSTFPVTSLSDRPVSLAARQKSHRSGGPRRQRVPAIADKDILIIVGNGETSERSTTAGAPSRPARSRELSRNDPGKPDAAGRDGRGPPIQLLSIISSRVATSVGQGRFPAPGACVPGPTSTHVVPQATMGANTSAMRAGFWMPCWFIHESAVSICARPWSPPRISPSRRRDDAA